MHAPLVLDTAAITACLDAGLARTAIAAGFDAYSAGRVQVPPVGHLAFGDGECHIKYGHVDASDVFVVKVATGFYGNGALGLPSSNGLMLVFSAVTGAPEAILLDGGMLTDLRTALAGAIAAEHLAPRDVPCIGILGTGIQARLQLEHLRSVSACRRALIWGRDRDAAQVLVAHARELGFEAAFAEPRALAAEARLIVTTTAASEPLLLSSWIRPGTHITAVGADSPNKQELDVALVARADRLIVDARNQCLDHGELQHAQIAGRIDPERISELGDVLARRAPGRTGDDEITIADLTGVAVQDIAIARTVLDAHRSAQVGA